MGEKRKKEGGRQQAKEKMRQGFGSATELQKAASKSQVKNGSGLH